MIKVEVVLWVLRFLWALKTTFRIEKNLFFVEGKFVFGKKVHTTYLDFDK